MTKSLLLTGTGVIAASALAVFLPLLVIQPWSDPDQPERPDDASTVLAPETSESGITPILATTDLGLGLNRVSFLLEGPTGFITVPEVSVSALYLPKDGSAPVAGESATAKHYVWPYGVRSSYATQLDFDTPGRWDLEVRLPDDGAGRPAGRIRLTVVRDTHTPHLGSTPPRGDNKTIRDVPSLEELTTWSTPDPQLYTTTIDQAVANADPTMVVFSSPGTCTSPTCGPQAETVSAVKDRYRDNANFIHVEVYDNPAAIQGDLDNARYSPVVEGWGITEIEGYFNESWVFILDRDGLITSKYQGFASANELELGLLRVLE
jgi:hypothetical protein